MVKRWRTGLFAQDAPQPPIGGTQHTLNHFAGDPHYDTQYRKELIRKHVRKRKWDTHKPTWSEFQGCLRAPKNKSAGSDGVPPHLLRHLPLNLQQQLYAAILDIWRGNQIPRAWLISRVVLIYKKKDPQDPKNYRPIYVSTAVYGILARLILKRITQAMTPGLLPIQHGAISGRNTTTLAAQLVNDLHKADAYVTLLDVAKAFPSVPRSMITDIIRQADAPEPIVRMVTEIYDYTPATLHLHGRDLRIHPKRGMKEGCPLSPTLFLVYYDVLLRETLDRQLDANLYVFVDDIAVGSPDTTTLLTTLDNLHHVAHRMGLRFNADKTEIYAWGRDCAPTTITWQGQRLDVRPPILTYLGHVLAHPSHEEHAWELVTTQLHHDLAAYKTLPLNGFEKVSIINSVLIPRWTYRAGCSWGTDSGWPIGMTSFWHTCVAPQVLSSA